MSTAPAVSPRGFDAASLTPDGVLMTRIAAGDTAAFEEIYRRHGQRVLQHARKICASRELAEEVAQEALISLWRGAHAYRPGSGSVGAWLFSVVRNRAIDAWRRAAVRPVEVEAFEDGPGQLSARAQEGIGDGERDLVLSLIAELPTAQKEAVFLAYFADMTHSEIATLADAPLGTIKGRMRLGLEKLRGSFEQQALGVQMAS